MTVPILQKKKKKKRLNSETGYRALPKVETTLDFKSRPWDLGDSYEWGSSVEGETPSYVDVVKGWKEQEPDNMGG